MRILFSKTYKSIKRRESPETEILFASLLYFCIYFTYVSTHDIPLNPAGFYLSSIEAVMSNGYIIPSKLIQFGDGIPFAYPPLSFYVSSLISEVTGDIILTAKYAPGIFYYIQSVLLLCFVYRWTGSKRISMWSFISFILMPQVVGRSIYGDGLITSISGIFMFLGWICATYSSRGWYKYDILGGVGVGAAVASHPIVGVFSALGYVVVKLSVRGFSSDWGKEVIVSVVASLLIVGPWVGSVIVEHGLSPFQAAAADSKSGLSLLKDPAGIVDYLLRTYTGKRGTITISLIPYGFSVIYCFLSRKYYIVTLLIISVLSTKGYPLTSAPLISICLGFFVEEAIKKEEINTEKKVFLRLAPYLVSVILFSMSIGLANIYYDSSGDKSEMYTWISENTPKDASFLKKGGAENIPFFTGRNIVYPGLGAEWMPSSTHQNGQKENRDFKRTFFGCREIKCLESEYKKVKEGTYVIYPSNKKYEKILSGVENTKKMQVLFENNSYFILKIV